MAIAVMLTALSAILPNQGLRYLGAAFALLVVGESGAALVTNTEFARVLSLWFYAGGTLGYVALILLYALREDISAATPVHRHTGWSLSATAGVLVAGLSLIAMLPLAEAHALSGGGLHVALSTLIGAAPILALVLIVNRRSECMISTWLIALLAVQALAWSGRHSPGSWGMQVALFSNLPAELALLNAIMLSIVQHVRTQMQTTRHLQTLAHTDGLTGLHNRRYLDDELEKACQRARRTGTSLSVLMADIDHFKLFNDTYGHLRGDDCLRQVAVVFLRRQQRCDDVACRYGGEEFAMILPACDLDATRMLATQLCNEVRALGIDHERSKQGRVTLSIGIATMQGASDPRGKDLLRLADDALYAAKRAGRDTICDMTQVSA
ncbi:GGDEF domain-containing protein [Pigmentiphaga aceris]|nr:GGDEF domain-containing protein [Pigmentiphaga aceris]